MSTNQHIRQIISLCSEFVFFQINRSDSDSSTLSKKSPFVRNASERRSMRMKKVDASLLPPDLSLWLHHIFVFSKVAVADDECDRLDTLEQS